MVNVNEIEEIKEYPEDLLGSIFEKQQELANKYVEIEGMGNLLDKTETNLDTKVGQMWIKDFLYRTIEEVGESYEVIFAHGIRPFERLSEEEEIHYAEELIDGLHFLVELCIIAGIKKNDIAENLNHLGDHYEDGMESNDFKRRHWNIVYYLTLAGNKLRNKKWKQTEVLTDRPIFKNNILNAFESLITALRAVGYNSQDIYSLYFKKNKVNQFRQRSKY